MTPLLSGSIYAPIHKNQITQMSTGFQASLKNTDENNMWKKAQELETTFVSSFFLQPFLESACGSRGIMGGGEMEKSFLPLLTNALARQLSGIGIADSIYAQLLKYQEKSS